MSEQNDSALSEQRLARVSIEWMTVPLGGDALGNEVEGLPAALDGRLKLLALAQRGKFVVDPDTSRAAIEQYRRLAAVLHQAQVHRGIRTAMVASAFAAEGKSLTAANLSLTLSESYRRRVLLIDADLRRPTLHDTFQIPNLAGLSDWLRADDATKLPRVEITPHLTLLPGGRPDPDPMGGLASERMKRVLQQASVDFDWVIVDTPPVAFLPDSHMLSAMVDTAVLVIGAGRTPAAAVQRAVNELGRDRIIGVVMNRVETEALHPYGQTYYDRYQGTANTPANESQG
jgi:protein-tyrosine kinase